MAMKMPDRLKNYDNYVKNKKENVPQTNTSAAQSVLLQSETQRRNELLAEKKFAKNQKAGIAQNVSGSILQTPIQELQAEKAYARQTSANQYKATEDRYEATKKYAEALRANDDADFEDWAKTKKKNGPFETNFSMPETNTDAYAALRAAYESAQGNDPTYTVRAKRLKEAADAEAAMKQAYMDVGYWNYVADGMRNLDASIPAQGAENIKTKKEIQRNLRQIEDIQNNVEALNNTPQSVRAYISQKTGFGADVLNALESLNTADADKAFAWLQQFTPEKTEINAGGVQTHAEAQQTKARANRISEMYMSADAKEKAAKEYLERIGYTYKQIKSALDTYTKLKNEYNMAQDMEKAAAFAREHPVLAQGLSIASLPVRGVAGVAAAVMDAGDPNSPLLAFNRYSEQVTATISDEIKASALNYGKRIGLSDEGAEFLGKAASVLYSAGISYAESQMAAAASAATGFGWLGELMMGTSAGVSAYTEALNTGMPTEQALATGFMAGVFESLFENLSIENIKFMKMGKRIAGREIIKNHLKSFITEGSEEVLTDLANELYDYIINGGYSKYEQYIKEQKAKGVSENAAKEQYWKDFGWQVLEDFAAGAISGLLSAGSDTVRRLGSARVYGSDVQRAGRQYEGGVSAMIQEAFGGLEQNKAQSRVLGVTDKTGALKTGSRVLQAYDALNKQQKSVMEDAFKGAGLSEDMSRRAADVYARLQYGDNQDQKKITKDDLLLLGDERVKTAIDELLADGSEYQQRQKAADRFALAVATAAASRNSPAEIAQRWADKKAVKAAKTRNEAIRTATNAVKANDTNTVVQTYAGTTDAGRVNVGAVRGTEDGDLVVVIDPESGATAKLGNVAFADEHVKDLYETVRDMVTGAADYGVKMDADAANALLSVAQKTGADPIAFMRDAYAAYAAGTTMRNRETYKIETEYDLTDEELDFAYDLGLRKYKVQPGVTRVGTRTISKQQLNELREIDEFAREKGLSVVVMDTLKGVQQTKEGKEIFSARGEVSRKDNVIYIALEAAERENVLSVTMFHEMFHWMGYQPGIGKQGQDALIDSVIQSLKGNKKVDLEAIRDQYRNAGYEESVIDEEIAAQYFGTVIADAGMRQKLAKQNAPLWKRVVEHLKAVLEDITERIKKVFAGDKAVQAAYLQDVKTIQRHIKEFEGVLDKVIAKTKAQRAEKAAQMETEPSADDGIVKHSIAFDENGKKVVVVDKDIFKNADGKSLAFIIMDHIEKTFHNRITVHGQTFKINKDTNDEWRKSKEARYYEENEKDVYYDKLKVIANADEILATAKKWINEEKKDNNKKFIGYARGYVNIYVNNQGYAADVIVGIQENGAATLYDLTNIKKTDTRLQGTENRSPRSARASDITDNSTQSEESQESKQSRVLDQEYMEAVKSGDEAEQARLVEQAARSAGYTDKLFHGTKNFGFTTFDPKFSADGFSFFAAGTKGLAGTYSGWNAERRIDKENKDYITAPISTVIKRFEKEVPEGYTEIGGQIRYIKPDVKYISEQQKYDMIDAANERLKHVQHDLKKILQKMGVNDKTLPVVDDINQILDLYNVRYAEPEYESFAAWDLAEKYDIIKPMLKYDIKKDLISLAEELSIVSDIEYQKEGGLFVLNYGEYTNEGLINVWSEYEVRKKLNDDAGNYALFGKPGKQLVIEGKRSSWFDVDGWKTGLQDTESYGNMTRDIARYAKDHGYDSVRINNIHDSGGRQRDLFSMDEDDQGFYLGTGTVYIYFEGKNLKSADPVTYDENGNIIPLSERFNPEENDIRRSRVVTEAEDAEIRRMESQNEEQRAQIAELRAMYNEYRKQSRSRRTDRDKIPTTKKMTDILIPYILNDPSDLKHRAAATDDVVQMINEFYAGDITFNQFIARLREWTTDEVKNAGHYEEQDDSLKKKFRAALRDNGKPRTVFLSEKDMNNVARNYGGRGEFRRAMFNKLNFTTKEEHRKKGLDVLYNELLQSDFGLEPTTDPSSQINNIMALYNMETRKWQSERKKAEWRGLSMDEIVTERTLALASDIMNATNMLVGADTEARMQRIAEARAELAAQKQQNIDRALKRADAMIREQTAEASKDTSLTSTDMELKKAKIRDEVTEKMLEQAYHERLRQQEKSIRREYQVEREKKEIRRRVRTLTEMLIYNTKRKNVPQPLKNSVRELVQNFANDDDIWGRKEKYFLQVELARLKTPDETGPTYDFRREREDLREAYETVKTELQNKGYYYGGGMKLEDLTPAQTDVVNMYTESVLYTINTANQSFLDARNGNILEDGGETIQRFKKIAQDVKDGKLPFVSAAKEMLQNDYLTTYYFFKEHMGGKIAEYFDSFTRAESNEGLKLKEINQFFEKTKKDCKYTDSWAKDKKELNLACYEFLPDTEEEIARFGIQNWNVSLSAETCMEIYAWWLRETNSGQESHHLVPKINEDGTVVGGGVVLDDDIVKDQKKLRIALAAQTAANEELKKGNQEYKEFLDSRKKDAKIAADKNRHMLTEGAVEAIIDTLTNEQKTYVKTVMRYLSEVGGGWGNEATQKWYGVRLFEEEWYFPYETPGDFSSRKYGLTNEKRLGNWGAAKHTQIEAKTPLVLSSFTDVAARHLYEMATYSEFLVPIEQMTELLSYSDLEGEDASVRSMIRTVFGNRAISYIDDVMTQLNGGVKGDEADDLINRMTGKFKAGAVMANASVVIQQPSAIMRAMGMIHPKYFVTTGLRKSDTKEMMTYSGVANLKDIGGFDTNMGMKIEDYLSGKKGGWDKLNDIAGWGAEKADMITWTHIWNAVKREISDTTELNAGSKEWYEVVKNRFEEVIHYTQVYDSVLNKNKWNRSKSGLVKMVTAFMNEPTMSLNMMMMSGKNHKMARISAIGAFVGNIVVNSILKGIVGAWRNRKDDESYLESWMREFVSNLIGDYHVAFLDGAWSPVGMIPWIKDILSMIQGYDIERTDVSILNDIITTAQKLIKSATLDDGNIATWELPDWDEFADFAFALAKAAGIPAGNVYRDAVGLYNSFNKSFLDVEWQYSKDAFWQAVKAGLGIEESNAVRAYKAVRNNETELERRMKTVTENDVQKLIDQGYTPEEAPVQAQINAQKRFDDLVAQGLTERDKRVQQAAELRAAAKPQQAKLIEDELIDEGFTPQQVYMAVNKAFDAMNPKDKNVSETKAATLFGTDDLTQALQARDKEAFDFVADQMREAGVKESTILNAVKKYAETLYETDNNPITLQNILSEYGGMSAAEASNEYDRIEKNWLIDNDERVRQAGTFLYNRNLADAEAIVNELLDEGYTENAVNDAVRSVVNELTPKTERETEVKETSLYKNQDLKNAIAHGDLNAFGEIADRIAEGEDSESRRRTVAKAYAKEAFAANGDADEAEQVLRDYGGIEQKDAEATVAYWEYQNTHKDGTLTESAYKKYYNTMVKNNAGIAVNTYEDFYNRQKECTGVDANGDGKTDTGSKQKQVIELLRGMNLTPAQKALLWDTLYDSRKYMPNW